MQPCARFPAHSLRVVCRQATLWGILPGGPIRVAVGPRGDGGQRFRSYFAHPGWRRQHPPLHHGRTIRWLPSARRRALRGSARLLAPSTSRIDCRRFLRRRGTVCAPSAPTKDGLHVDLDLRLVAHARDAIEAHREATVLRRARISSSVTQGVELGLATLLRPSRRPTHQRAFRPAVARMKDAIGPIQARLVGGEPSRILAVCQGRGTSAEQGRVQDRPGSL